MKMRNLSLLTAGLLAAGTVAPALFAADVAGYQTKSDKAQAYSFTLGDGEKAKVLQVVLDESKPGKGLDTVVADANLDGKLSDDKSVPAQVQQAQEAFRVIQCPLPEAKGVFGPARAAAVYKPQLIVYSVKGQKDTVICAVSIEMGQGVDAYVYSIRGEAKPDSKNTSLSTVRFGTPPTIELNTALTDGELSVASSIKDQDGQTISVSKAGKPALPHLKILDPAQAAFVDKDLSYG